MKSLKIFILVYLNFSILIACGQQTETSNSDINRMFEELTDTEIATEALQVTQLKEAANLKDSLKKFKTYTDIPAFVEAKLDYNHFYTNLFHNKNNNKQDYIKNNPDSTYLEFKIYFTPQKHKKKIDNYQLEVKSQLFNPPEKNIDTSKIKDTIKNEIAESYKTPNNKDARKAIYAGLRGYMNELSVEEEDCIPVNTAEFKIAGQFDYSFDQNCSKKDDSTCWMLSGNSRKYPSYTTPMGAGVPWVTVRKDEIRSIALELDPWNACHNIELKGNGNAVLVGDAYQNIQLFGDMFPSQTNYFVEARRKEDNKIVGKLNVTASEEKKDIKFNIKFVLIKQPGEEEYPSYGKSWDDIVKNIKRIYYPLFVELNFNTGNLIRKTVDFDKDGNGAFTNSNTERNSIINSITKEEGVHYVFIVDEMIKDSEGDNINGFARMNRAYPNVQERPYAFVTTQSSNGSMTIPHELGHSIFGLKDVRDEFGQIYDPINIMNYGRQTGAKLKTYQILRILNLIDKLRPWDEE